MYSRREMLTSCVTAFATAACRPAASTAEAPKRTLAVALNAASFRPEGDLKKRFELNYNRLQDDQFRFAAMKVAPTLKNAPGDWIGRAILALCLGAQALGKEPPHLAEVMRGLPSCLNKRGYMGDELPAGQASECQLAGHTGLIRGLCAYHTWTADAKAIELLGRIVDRLVVPAGDCFASYPVAKLAARQGGGAVATALAEDGNWHELSSDIGQAFMILDAATEAYTVLPSAKLKATIEAGIARFAEIDPETIGAQTHGMLTGVRGVLRHYEATGEAKYLAIAEKRLAAYTANATTENHANYNWFGRPDWTEPCAVVDAFSIALWLARLTGKAEHAEQAHRIYYNALLYGQRPNGGFGCDRCVSVTQQFLEPFNEVFEAPWCCTMRGAEAFSLAGRAITVADADSITLPFYVSGAAELPGGLKFRIDTRYPTTGEIDLTVQKIPAPKEVTFRFFVPSWAVPGTLNISLNGRATTMAVAQGFAEVRLTPKAGDVLALRFDQQLGAIDTHVSAKTVHRYAHGALLLGRCASSPAVNIPRSSTVESMQDGRYRVGDEALTPLTNLTWMKEDDARRDVRQLVFRTV
jgi:hypothetical protein